MKLIKSFQTIRFFAAVGILQFHLWKNYFGVATFEVGTDIFLVLTGVVAAYSQAKRISEYSWWRYISSRYKRLYVTFIPLFIITLIMKIGEADLNWVLKSFFFIPLANRLPVIGATWMLSMFILFYFIFSLCFIMKSENIIWGLFAVWAILILAYNFFNLIVEIPEEWSGLLFSERNLEIILGYFIGVILRNQCIRQHYSIFFVWVGLIGVIGDIFLLGMIANNFSRTITVGVPVMLIILGLGNLELNNSPNRTFRFLVNPWLVWLGDTSYVLFLSHGIFLQGWSRTLPTTPIWALPISVGAIVAGCLGYIFWEYPILTYIKSKRWAIGHLPFNHQHK